MKGTKLSLKEGGGGKEGGKALGADAKDSNDYVCMSRSADDETPPPSICPASPALRLSYYSPTHFFPGLYLAFCLYQQ